MKTLSLILFVLFINIGFAQSGKSGLTQKQITMIDSMIAAYNGTGGFDTTFIYQVTDSLAEDIAGISAASGLDSANVSSLISDSLSVFSGGADSSTVNDLIQDFADSTNRFADALTSDQNYVSDAQLVVIGNTSGTNSGDNAVNTLYSGLASSKQDALISGTNIKTINSTSLLGSGNITISGVDSSVVNDLIGTYIDTMASDTSEYTLDEIDKVVKNATISRYDISNPALADTFMIFWADDSLEVDSIKCYADDSTTIQIIMDQTNMLSSAYLIDDGVSSTITTINEGTLLADKKARLYFTALGDNVKKVHLKIYWRYL